MIYRGFTTGKNGVRYSVVLETATYNLRFTTANNEELFTSDGRELLTLENSGITEIILSDSPFIISYEGDDNIYKPLKLSGATIRCWLDNYFMDLFTGEAQGVKCTIYKDPKDGVNTGIIIWKGYVTPNLYSQDYNKNKFVLELECVDCISVSQHFKYKVETKEIRSFLDILRKFILICNSHSTKFNFNVSNFSNKRLDELYISDQNWFDEDDEPMTYKEVLEHILTYCNLTMFQYNNFIYIVDYDKIKSGDYSCYSYSFTDDYITPILEERGLSIKELNISSEKKYTDSTISLSEVYNKITVNSSLYNFDNLIDEITNSKLTIESADSFAGINNKAWYKGRKLSNSSYNFLVNDFDSNDWKNGISGGFLKGIGKETEEGTSEKNWKEVLAVRSNHSMDNIPFLKVGKNIGAAFGNGYFSINFDFYQSSCDIPFPNEDWKESDTTAVFPYLMAQFKLGNKYLKVNTDTIIYTYEWVDEPQVFKISAEGDRAVWKLNRWQQAKRRKPYGKEIPSSLDGFIVPLDDVITGDIELTLFTEGASQIIWQFVKNLKIEFSKVEIKPNGIITNKDLKDTDTIFETVIYDNNISEFDEIDLKVSTDNEKGLSFSAVLYKDASNNYQFLKSIDKGEGEYIMEQYLLNSYYNQYKQPNKVIDTTIKCIISPLHCLKDSNWLTKKFIVNKSEIDYPNNISTIQIIEKQ